jgi:hypothetical protein
MVLPLHQKMADAEVKIRSETGWQPIPEMLKRFLDQQRPTQESNEEEPNGGVPSEIKPEEDVFFEAEPPAPVPISTELDLLRALVMEVLSRSRAALPDDRKALARALAAACSTGHPSQGDLFAIFADFVEPFVDRAAAAAIWSAADSELHELHGSTQDPDGVIENQHEQQQETMTATRKRFAVGTIFTWAQRDSRNDYSRVLARALRSKMRRCKPGDADAAARLLHFLYGREVVCAAKKGSIFYNFNGTRWVRDGEALTLRQNLREEVVPMFSHEASKTHESSVKGRLMETMAKLQQTPFKNRVLQVSRDHFLDSSFLENLDVNPGLLGFEDGVYDLDADAFRPGRPDDLVSFSTGYHFPRDVNPEIRDEILEALSHGVADVEKTLNALASTLHGAKFNGLTWFFAGKGWYIKVLLAETLMRAALGQYFSRADTKDVLKPPKKPTPDNRGLNGVRFVSVTEERKVKMRPHALKNCKVAYCSMVPPTPARLTPEVSSSMRVLTFADVPEIKDVVSRSVNRKFGSEQEYGQQFMLMLLERYRALTREML